MDTTTGTTELTAQQRANQPHEESRLSALNTDLVNRVELLDSLTDGLHTIINKLAPVPVAVPESAEPASNDGMLGALENRNYQLNQGLTRLADGINHLQTLVG